MPQRRNGNFSEQAKPPSDKPINRLPATAQQAAGAVRQLASDTLTSAGQKADDMAASLGGSMKSLASNIRANAPTEQALGQLATSAADFLERTGQFLQQEGIQGLTNEVNQLVRRYPFSAVCVAFGVGFLLAQTPRR
jgi:ElaB/YqjD/DUF883 family membrane-anchored ribosome-binding protein